MSTKTPYTPSDTKTLPELLEAAPPSPPQRTSADPNAWPSLEAAASVFSKRRGATEDDGEGDGDGDGGGGGGEASPERPPGDPPLERVARGRHGPPTAGTDAPPSGPPTAAWAAGRTGRRGDDAPTDGPPGDPPSGGSRIRGGVVTKISVGSGAGGMEGLMAFPPVSRGSDPLPPEPEPDAPPPRPEPPRLPTVAVDAQLAPDQRTGPGGVDRERMRERVEERIDFRYQRYESLRVTLAQFRCPVRPDLDLEGVRARWPAFAAGRTPLGNGYIARLVEATFGDGASLAESARSLSVIGPSLKPGHLGGALDRAAAAVQPVMARLRDDLASAKGIKTDAGVAANWFVGGRARAGQVFAVTAGDRFLLVPAGADGADPDGQALLDRAQIDGAPTEAWARDATGRSRRGQWGVLRRRLAIALPWQPRPAGMGLHRALQVQQAWTADPDLPTLKAAAAEMKAWLDAHRSPSPETHLQRAATYGADNWRNLNPVDARGRLRAEDAPAIKEPPVVWRPVAEVSLQTAVTWATLVEGCLRRGVRPWTYIDAVLDAALHDRLGDGARFAPAAWRG